MGIISYHYFGGATQVLVTGNLNEASGLTGFVLLRFWKLRITLNEVVTVLVAMSAYSTIPVRSACLKHPFLAVDELRVYDHIAKREPSFFVTCDLMSLSLHVSGAAMVADAHVRDSRGDSRHGLRIRTRIPSSRYCEQEG